MGRHMSAQVFGCLEQGLFSFEQVFRYLLQREELEYSIPGDAKPFQALARGERKPEYVRVATFRSAGEDGAFETGDDIVWRVMADGSTSE